MSLQTNNKQMPYLSDKNQKRSGSSASWLLSVVLHTVVILLLLLTTSQTINNSINNSQPVRIVSTDQNQQPQTALETQAISPTAVPVLMPEVAINDSLTSMTTIAPLTVINQTPLAGQKNAVRAPVAQSMFFGTSGQGQRICYLVDVSGSMIMAIEYIKKELTRSISQLEPDQYFQIVFYSGPKPEVLLEAKLTRASYSNRQQAIEFINGIDVRRAMPGIETWRPLLNALHAGFDSQSFDRKTANLVYLFTDGNFDSEIIMPVIDTIQQNKRPAAVINVILCGSINNEEKLIHLAQKYQGQYQFLTDDELVNPSRISSKTAKTLDIFK